MQNFDKKKKNKTYYNYVDCQLNVHVSNKYSFEINKAEKYHIPFG